MNSYLQKKIFITDDDPIWRLLLHEMLEGIKCTDIVHFSCGADCIRHLYLNPDIIFLDYQMNDLNGLQVLKKIREILPDTLVIFCSEHEKINVAVEAMKNGSFDYIIKSKLSEEYLQSMMYSLYAKAMLEVKIY